MKKITLIILFLSFSSAYSQDCDVPSGNSVQYFCQGSGDTVSDLDIEPDDPNWVLTWYEDVSANTQINDPTNEVLQDGEFYYVTQTNPNGCGESNTFEIEVIEDTTVPPAPTGANTQEFCEGETVSDLDVQGTNLNWYIQFGNNVFPIPSTYQITDGDTVLVTQTPLGCESNPLTITVVEGPEPPSGENEVSVCETDTTTLADIPVTGQNLNWYSNPQGTNSIPDTTPITEGTNYYVTQTIDGCESETFNISAVRFPVPPAGLDEQIF